jgi:hypothetical protein
MDTQRSVLDDLFLVDIGLLLFYISTRIGDALSSPLMPDERYSLLSQDASAG